MYVQEKNLGEEWVKSVWVKSLCKKSQPLGWAKLFFSNKVSLGGLGAERPETDKNEEIRW